MEQEQKKKELRRKAMQLPLSPGVYIMHNKAGDIIYIGKAKALKNRVSQYFGSEKNHDNKVRRMVSNVDWFEYILCDSEFEALVLESSLIKPVSYTHLDVYKRQEGKPAQGPKVRNAVGFPPLFLLPVLTNPRQSCIILYAVKKTALQS